MRTDLLERQDIDVVDGKSGNYSSENVAYMPISLGCSISLRRWTWWKEKSVVGMNRQSCIISC